MSVLRIRCIPALLAGLLPAFATTAFAEDDPPVAVPADVASADEAPGRNRRSGTATFWLGNIATRSGITGEWWGHRTDLADEGVVFAGSSVTEWAAVPSGQGVVDGASFRYLVGLGLELDLGKLIGLAGGTGFVDFQVANQTVDGAESGSVAGFSNIGVDQGIHQVSEAWYDQVLDDGRWRFRVGKIDANAEYGFLASAQGFIASSAGLLSTTFALPTYPNPAFGINGFLEPSEGWRFGLGVFDGSGGADGIRTGGQGPASVYDAVLDGKLFLIAAGHVRTPDLLGDRLSNVVEVGGWWNSGRFDAFGGGTKRGTGGTWVNLEQRLWAPDSVDASDDADLQGLWAFGQFGWTPDDISSVGVEWGAGVSVFGTFPGREDDSTGLYWTWTGFSRDPAAGIEGAGETLLEAYYDIAVTPWCVITPDVQYVIDPGGDTSIPNTWTFTLRLTVNF